MNDSSFLQLFMPFYNVALFYLFVQQIFVEQLLGWGRAAGGGMTCQTIQTQFLLSQRLQVGAGFNNEKNPAKPSITW